MNKYRTLFPFLAVLILILAGCAPAITETGTITYLDLATDSREGNTKQVQAGSDFDERYIIAVGDELEIKFPYKPDFNEKVLVLPDGKISLAIVNSMTAAGKTVSELERDLINRYKETLNKLTAGPEDVARKQYLINVGDSLEIKFPYYPDFNEKVMVRPDGRISLSLVKSVIAEGKTPEQLEKELTQRYSAFLKNPELVVIVRDFSSNQIMVDGQAKRPAMRDIEYLVVIVRNFTPAKIFVGGEVARQGFLPYRGPITATQAIMESGGYKVTGDMRSVIVLRKTDDRHATMTVLNLNGYVGDEVKNDASLRPFDVVIVPKTTIATVNEFLDQYLYTLLPITKNSSFSFIYDLKGSAAIR